MVITINHLLLLMVFIGLFAEVSLAQSNQQPLPKPIVYSSSSDWLEVNVTKGVERKERLSNASSNYRPAFSADFVMNRNRWRAGNLGDYEYKVGVGTYSIRKRNVHTNQIAFSSVNLPQNINLNRSEIFTIKVDVLADSGKVASGGLVFGVKDSLNYVAFTTNIRGDVSIKRVANGQTFADYMTGEYFRPGIPLEKNRNRLTVKRRGEYLHFYINDQEIRTSPYLFRLLSGNGIGLTSTGYWTAFQKLNVTVGL